MSKQEDIREGLEEVLKRTWFTCDHDVVWERMALASLCYLHDNDVAIKVDDPNLTPVAFRVAVEPLMETYAEHIYKNHKSNLKIIPGEPLIKEQ